MKIILIAGKALSGKTELGGYLKELLSLKGLKVMQTEYSKYLKMYATEILLYDGDRKNKPRKFLQDTGSYIRENLKDEDFFVRRFKEDLRIYENYFDVIIISDVRLIHEIEEIKKSKYEIISIKIINRTGKYDLDKEEAEHITEHELDSYVKFNYIIENESLNILKEHTKNIVQENFEVM